jgi:tetratricopeptide (TPR) repeat protein
VFGLAIANGAYGVVDRGILAVAVWWTIAVCVALRLWPRGAVPKAALVVGGSLAALTLLSALSISWSPSAERAFIETDRVLLYLGVFVLGVMASRRGEAARWCDGVAVGIAAVGVLALLSELYPETIGPGQPPIFFPGEDRLSWPLNYWNGLGIFIGLGYPLLLRAAAAGTPVAWRALALAPVPAMTAALYLTSSRGAAATAAFGVLVFILLTGRRLSAIVALLVSSAGAAAAIAVLVARHALVDGPPGTEAAASQADSAAVLLALISAGVSLAFWGWIRFGERRLGAELSRAGTFALAGAACIALVIAAAAVDPVQKYEDFKEPPSEQRIDNADFTKAHLLSANGSGRWQIWDSALEQFSEHPVKGEGAGSFEAWWAENGNLQKFLRDAHSLYLETMGELGLLGLIALVGALGGGFAVGLRRTFVLRGSDRATVAALVATLAGFALAAAIDWMWELTVVAVVALLCLALLTGEATLPHVRRRDGDRDATSPQAPRRRRLPAGARAAVVAFAVVAICVEGVLLLSQARLDDSRAAAQRGDRDEALSAALDARAIQPWAASPYLQLALLEEESQNLRAAHRRIREAIDRDGSDWRLYLVSARISVKLGLIREARKDLARARALNPRSPLFSKRSE